jgi:16S rRNA (uracil1498-N3)-methyltransferase
MRRRFFVDRFESSSAALRGDAAEHLGRVLRAEPGELLELSDGRNVWLARIERVALSKRGDNRIEFALVEPVPAREPALEIDLLLALVKFDCFEWCIEKSTELGAKRITPLAAARTDSPLVAAAAKRMARWEKIVLESAQQSRRLRPPTIASPIAPEKAFLQCSANAKILLSEKPEVAPLREILANLSPIAASGDAVTVALAIGPEGGWTDQEIAAAGAAGFLEASLGENILRTETAVLASMAVLRFALAG